MPKKSIKIRSVEMTTNSVVKGVMIGLAIGLLNDVVGKYIPQAKAI